MMRNAARLMVPATNLAGQKITALLAAAILMAAVSRTRADQTVTLQAGDNYVTCQVVGGSSNNIVDPLFLDPAGFPVGFGADDIFNPTVLFFFPDPCSGNIASVYFYFNGDLENPPGWYDNNDLGGGAVSTLPWNPGEGIIVRKPLGAPLTMTLTLKGAPRPLPLAKTLTPGCLSLLGSQVLGADTFENITGHPANHYNRVEIYRHSPSGTANLPVVGTPPGGWDLYTCTAGTWSPPFPALNAGESVYVVIPRTLNWTGAVNGTWDIGITPNWSSGGVATTYADGDHVIFDDSAAGVTDITITVGGVAPASVTVNNNSRAYSFVAPHGIGCQRPFPPGCDGFAKMGFGSLTLLNINTYSGPTNVNAGTLFVDGSLAGGGVVSVLPGAQLGGNGTIAGPVVILSGGIVAPGHGGIGTLTTGSASLNGDYDCEIGGNSSDELVVVGDLDLSCAVLNVMSTGTWSTASYRIASYSGALTGTFGSIVGLPDGYTLDYSSANQVRVVAGCKCDRTYHFSARCGGLVPPLPPNVVTMNLTRDAQGCLGLDPTGRPRPFPYVWMAESKTGTMVRIDVNSGAIMGRYRTAPDGTSPSPSRTTVDHNGECWVGNRTDDRDPVGGPQAIEGSVTRVGLVIGGTRCDSNGATNLNNGQYLKGPFTYLSKSVKDRDGDGLIHTAMPTAANPDGFPALPWVGAANADTGAQSGAQDELITNFTRVSANGVRALAVDKSNDLWVGGLGNQFIHKIRGASGLTAFSHSASSAYGAIINHNNELWLADRLNNRITRWDLNVSPPTRKPDISTPEIYGLGIDTCTGIVTSDTHNSKMMRQHDTAGNPLPTFSRTNSAKGLCVDYNGRAWVSRGDSTAGVDVYEANPTAGPTFHQLTGVSTPVTGTYPITGATGTAVDTNGNIWVSDLKSNSAIRIDGVTKLTDKKVSLLANSEPYNYSDKTGYIGISSAGAFGFLEVVHDSGCNTDLPKRWNRVIWGTQGTASATCSIKTYVRADDNPLLLGTKPWKQWNNGQMHCVSVCPGDAVRGRYLQVRVEFRGPPGCNGGCDLRLCSLRVECCPDSPVSEGPIQLSVVLGNPCAVLDPFPYDRFRWAVFHIPGPLPKLVPITGSVLTSSDSPVAAEWRVNGVVVATQTVTSGPVELAHAFGDGIHEVTLRVSAGDQISEATTTVEIGDHTPPQFVPVGMHRLANWSGTIPDFLATVQVTDPDGVGDPPLVVTQSIPAGTIVGQGLHEVTLTATDAAGNIAVEYASYLVAPVVALNSPKNYETFAAGTPIPVSYTVAEGVSGITSVVLRANGATVATLPGPGVPASVTLAPGEYTLRIVAFGPGGAVSEGQEIGVTVKANPYVEWAALYPGFDLANQGADLDGDGMSNRQEYAFGLNPTLGWSVNPIAVPINRTTGTFGYTRRDPALTELTYTVWTSTDLLAWTVDPGAGQSVTSTNGDVQTVAVTLSGAPLAPPKMFVRVKAE